MGGSTGCHQRLIIEERVGRTYNMFIVIIIIIMMGIIIIGIIIIVIIRKR